MEVEIRQERLTPEIGNILINFLKAWETENNCYGYQANKPSDIEGRTIFVANENKVPPVICSVNFRQQKIWLLFPITAELLKSKKCM